MADRAVKISLYGEYVYVGKMAEGIDFLENLVPVERSGFGKDATYTKKIDGESPEFDLIRWDQFSAKKEDQFELMRKKLEEAEKRTSDSNTKRWKLESEMKELKGQLEAFAKLCPVTPDIAEEGKDED